MVHTAYALRSREGSPPPTLTLESLRRLSALLGLFLVGGASFGHAQSQYILPRINGPVILDGLSTEPAWEGIEPLPVVEHRPNFGNEPSERTEIIVAFDEDYLYVAGRLFDGEASGVQAPSKKRDSENPGSDWFGIALDTFNDKENALAFFTTPTGLRWDAAILTDAQGGISHNISWNTLWDVAVVRNEEGWFAEMRIPFSSLRFQDEDGRVVMGLISWRQIARKEEWVIFPAIPSDWGFMSFYKISEAQEVVFEGLRSHKPLHVAPYLLLGTEQTSEINVDESAYQRTGHLEYEAGLDVKYGLSSNLTLDATMNTDFAQVEADDQQVNLTRFSLFFPEKRLFFQERSSVFDFNFESSEPNRLFYSRRIGIYDGKPVRIFGGARLVGRVGPWDLGFLGMHTDRVEDHPSEHLSVFRLRRQIFNPYSYVGGITTTRIGMDGSYNVAYGLDATLRLFGDEYLTLKWAQTFETEKQNNLLSADPTRIRILWQRRTQRGFGYGLSYSFAGADYEPGVGFELRDNYTRFSNGLWYGWFPGEKSLFFRHRFMTNGFLVLRNTDAGVESAQIGPKWEFELKSGYSGHISPQLCFEDVPEAFYLSDDAEILGGRYTFYGLNGEFTTPRGRLINTSVNLSAGSFYDGSRFSLGFSQRWNASSSVELRGTYQYNRIVLPNRGQRFAAHIGRLRVLYMLDTRISATAFIQYSNAIDAITADIRLRYNPREGIDLYLVYGESMNTNRYGEIPVLPVSDNRTIMLKYAYTFNLY